jgi:hypothetical protein
MPEGPKGFRKALLYMDFLTVCERTYVNRGFIRSIEALCVPASPSVILKAVFGLKNLSSLRDPSLRSG